MATTAATGNNFKTTTTGELKMRGLVLKNIIIITASILLFGCATSPDKMTTTYVSPDKYQDHKCEKLAQEMERVSTRTVELHQTLDDKADADAAQMGVGLVLFLPALLLLEGGDGPEAVEYSNLKGEFAALKTTSEQKACDPSMIPRSPEDILAERAKEKQQRQASAEEQ